MEFFATEFFCNSVFCLQETSKKRNKDFHFELVKCPRCSFQTESETVLANHQVRSVRLIGLCGVASQTRVVIEMMSLARCHSMLPNCRLAWSVYKIWANFRLLGDCLLWAVFWKNCRSPNFCYFFQRQKLSVNFVKRWLGLHFGRFFFTASSGYPAYKGYLNKSGTVR
jgi:hypothetical protein